MADERLGQMGDDNTQEDITTEETGSQQPEVVASKERTRESEIQANVEFWKGLGIEVDEADVRAEIEKVPEVEGFDWYHYVPQGITSTEVCRMMSEKFKIGGAWGSNDADHIGKHTEQYETPRTTKIAYAIGSKYSQYPDKNTIGMSERDGNAIGVLRRTGKKYMDILERLILELRWFGENGSHLDNDGSSTICPNNMLRGTNIIWSPKVSTFIDHDTVQISSQKYYHDLIRPREIITAETKTEEK